MRTFVIAVTSLLLLSFCAGLMAQEWPPDYENIKKEDFFMQLKQWQDREAAARQSIADEQAKQEQIKADMMATDEEDKKCWNEIYAMLGTDEAGYNAFIQQCQALLNDVNGFVSMSPEEIYSRRAELDTYENRLAELRKNKISLGPEPYDILQRVESLIQQGRDKADPGAAGKYEVARGDYLWKIAGRNDIYGDSYTWMRIYSANRTQIKNPDLIYPNQVFDIPRGAGPGEHWVARGESLSDIAKRYGSVFSWQRIYENNKDNIGADPNTIYPHMILSIPGN